MSVFTHELHTEIDVEAPPDVVWAHLLDVGAYHEWNPFITSLRGPVQVGARLSVRLEPPGGRAMTFRPRVTELVEGHTLEWLGHLAVPGVFDGRHRFELTPRGSSSHLVQAESFRGALVPLLRRGLDEHTRPGFVAMNTALARRAEGSPPLA